MRCPDCGAANPPGAAFCGQCYTRFAAPADAAAPADGPAAAGADAAADPPAATGGGPTGAAAVGRFTAADGQLTWRCAVCDTTNPVASFTCEVCGSRMDAESAPGSDVDWPAARRAEAVVPGLGHVRAGQSGMGYARMGIVGLWLAGALLLSLGGADGIATALPLVIGVAAVWVTGPMDLDAARAGRAPRLDPRGFLYLVIGVTLGVIIAGGLTIAL